MADKAVPAIAVAHLGQPETGHQRGGPPPIGQLHKQVEVTRHDATVLQARRKTLPVPGQQAEEVTEVGGIGEERLAIVATTEDMVGGPISKLHSAWPARHRGCSGFSAHDAVHFSLNLSLGKGLAKTSPFSSTF